MCERRFKVPSSEVDRLIEHLLVQEHIVAEPAAAATTAAWMADSRSAPNASIVLLVTGSNIAEPNLRQALTRENTPSEHDEPVPLCRLDGGA